MNGNKNKQDMPATMHHKPHKNHNKHHNVRGGPATPASTHQTSRTVENSPFKLCHRKWHNQATHTATHEHHPTPARFEHKLVRPKQGRTQGTTYGTHLHTTNNWQPNTE
jgi:hypothetical protein